MSETGKAMMLGQPSLHLIQESTADNGWLIE